MGHDKSTVGTIAARISDSVLIIENEVVRRVRSQQTDFKDLIERLNDCSANTVKLHRRWHFQHTLAETIDELVKSDEPEDLKSPRSAQSTEKAERIALNKKYPLLVRRVAAQQKLIQSIKYDLEVLPRRISNQSTAINNVITQCNSQTSIMIAKQSAQIAVLTVVFLPATFICAFFSMTMFNWNGQAGEALVSGYIWVYFAVTVPLTLLVIGIWWFSTAHSRAAQAKWEDGLPGRRYAPGDVENGVVDASVKKDS